MARKVGSRQNHRVVVEAMVWLDTSTETLERRCREIAASIRRHIDEIGSVWIESDSNNTCEHCGEPWTESNADYNGGCCDADEAANPNPSE